MFYVNRGFIYCLYEAHQPKSAPPNFVFPDGHTPVDIFQGLMHSTALRGNYLVACIIVIVEFGSEGNLQVSYSR